ncbi:ent-kaurene oxidase [Colletotrichum cuscutae]|uniref:Ent-kaurene oxidase n=1 Tax=Colletotrichum cuscutae TaxID=1209917 RepID=A0AAI9V977_9PEZI|nr:ent-kaurene oxidase [Colletotrichum cuscutae]
MPIAACYNSMGAGRRRRDATHEPSAMNRYGSLLAVSLEGLRDASQFADPDVFDGFRFARKRQEPGQENQWQFTSTRNEFLVANELKIFLAELLIRYDIGYPAGVTRPPCTWFATESQVNMDTPLVFKLREKAFHEPPLVWVFFGHICGVILNTHNSPGPYRKPRNLGSVIIKVFTPSRLLSRGELRTHFSLLRNDLSLYSAPISLLHIMLGVSDPALAVSWAIPTHYIQLVLYYQLNMTLLELFKQRKIADFDSCDMTIAVELMVPLETRPSRPLRFSVLKSPSPLNWT